MAVCLQVTSTFEEDIRSGVQRLVLILVHFSGAICNPQMIALLFVLLLVMSRRIHPSALPYRIITNATVSIHAVGVMEDWART